MTAPVDGDAIAIGAAVRAGQIRAVDIVRAALDRIAVRNVSLNAFTDTFADTAMADAALVDREVAEGADPGPLAGVPFAVKNLFDVAGRITLAGSKIRRDAEPALRDATIVARLRAAGAVLVGATNMDEFAYGFTTENAHYGPTRNPHDPLRSAGGSSGGSAAAVAGRIVPLSLGSDTNGSIRVPAALCGIFGLKPTFGRLSRSGAFPFVHELDHVGPFARSVRDLALAYDAMQGPDDADNRNAQRPPEPVSANLNLPIDGLRVGTLGGWFRDGMADDVGAAADRVGAALGASEVVLNDVAEARAAAFCLTAASGAALHLPDLTRRPQDFDPATRDRFFAGALLPPAVIEQVGRIRRRFRDQLRTVFQSFDVLIAPATPCSAPLIGQTILRLGDQEVPLRPNLGIYTQPISFIGLPVAVVPVDSPGLPVGVQLVGPAWREDLVLRAARQLERLGVASARPTSVDEGG